MSEFVPAREAAPRTNDQEQSDEIERVQKDRAENNNGRSDAWIGAKHEAINKSTHPEKHSCRDERPNFEPKIRATGSDCATRNKQ